MANTIINDLLYLVHTRLVPPSLKKAGALLWQDEMQVGPPSTPGALKEWLKAGKKPRKVRVFEYSRLDSVAEDILAWLKRQKTWHHEKPLLLDRRHQRSRDLEVTLSSCPELARLFEIKGDECNFRASVTAEERSCLREIADACYRPTVIP